MRYRPDIDGLRALAVSAVIGFHAGVPGVPGGYLGVDVFFVISGFLITTILADEMSAGRFSFAGFYERRARRILPALGCVAAVSLGPAWILMTPEQLMAFAESLLALGLFASNLHFWRQSDYFAPAMEEAPLLHTWSLGVEEQFYLVFPLVLWLLWRRGRAGTVLGIMAAVSLALALGVEARGWERTAFYLLPMRAWELLAGALVALYLGSRGPLDRGAGGLAALGLLMIIGGIVLAGPEMGPAAAAGPVAGAALLLATRPGSAAHRLLGLRPLVAIGLVSYSAYLWHQPVFAYARIARLDPPGAGLMAVLVVVTFGLAALTWVAVEQPFRDRRRIGRGRVFGLSAACLGAMIGLGAMGLAGQGFGPARFEPGTLALLDSMEASPRRAACHAKPAAAPPPGRACHYGAAVAPDWAILGDSHGVELAVALGERLAGQGAALVQFTASGCPPALGYATPVRGCADWTEARLAWIEANPQIRHVVLAYRHSAYLFGENGGTYPALPDQMP
ncbi:MAG: acyltransferase family protein, partial [Pseudomonadota bacterium]